MKKTFTGIAFIAIVGMMACNQPTVTVTTGGETHWSHTLDITPKSTKHNLDSVAASWMKDSVTLKFTNLQFDSVKGLVKFAGTMDVISKGKHANVTFSEDSSRSMEVKAGDGPDVSAKRM